jgi:low molecular weight protein-tyrosine phosphatase
VKVVLFLCTGNYYRSRFAEELFNFLAPAQCPDWVAVSRGLAVHLGSDNIGPIARQTVDGLRRRGVHFDPETARAPIQVETGDLVAADHVVALKYVEHYPLLRNGFFSSLSTNDISRIEYWDVHDLDFMAPDKALPLIERRLDDLMVRLRGAQTEMSKRAR